MFIVAAYCRLPQRGVQGASHVWKIRFATEAAGTAARYSKLDEKLDA
ncbi:hypothetical protein [Silvimonas soli]|nr:hypothetical protein [Silvimonas soli]